MPDARPIAAIPVEDVNRTFYEQAYSQAAGFPAAWRRQLSFDQQSKLHLNWLVLESWLREGRSVRRVLEVGFGFGLILRRFPSGVTLVGTEISLNAARQLSQTCLSGQRRALVCVHDSVGGLPFKTEFDVIICSHVLEHVPDDMSLLKEFRRLLVPKGVLLLNVPINEELPDPKHVRAYDDHSLRRKLSDAGFHLIRELTADRWSAFFERWQARYRSGLILKIMRAGCALMPYAMSEWISDIWLRALPVRQLIVLAVPEEDETTYVSQRS